MNKVITSEKVPIKLWLDDIEDVALEQAKNLANLPFVFKHIAIMPDSHQGYGMPIGGVMATKDVIVINAIGVDIACGVCAIKTNITGIHADVLKSIMSDIRSEIPVGFKRHQVPQEELLNNLNPDARLCPIAYKEHSNALHSAGTLGGGNHFIEIQKDGDGNIWIMIHSGSRNLGKKVADYYNIKAKELNAKWHSNVPALWDLAFLPTDSFLGQDYIREMNYCVKFAYVNRWLMMKRILNILNSYHDVPVASISDMINIAHNYATLENHFGQNVWVHRKGATLARDGIIGIIPGSQGTKSYIVKGLGNPQSFMSCSHGAGRKMGRKQARENLDLATEIAKLDASGVVHSIRSEKDLDEAPSAYKDISVVMQNQRDLVEIIEELTPIAVIKG